MDMEFHVEYSTELSGNTTGLREVFIWFFAHVKLPRKKFSMELP